jgi:hypothetical protein
LAGCKASALVFQGDGVIAIELPFKWRRQPHYVRGCRLRNKFRQDVSEWSRILLGGNAVIDWTSQKQKAVGLSTSEAEYVSQSKAVREIMWLRKAFQELGLGQKGPTTAFQDHSAAIAWSGEDAYTKRCKHIDVRYHFSAEQVRFGNVTVKFVGTKDGFPTP